MTSHSERHPGFMLASSLRSSASKTAGRRRGQPLTVAETADNAAVLATTFAVSAAVAAGWWWLRSRPR